MKNMKLATKIALILCSILVVIFTIFISITVIQSCSQIVKATVGEMEAIAQSNGETIQKMFESVEVTVNDLSDYLQKSYQKRIDAKANAGEQQTVYRSGVYPNLDLTHEAALTEEFLHQTVINAVVNNENIVTAGVFFEPYAFDKNQEIYGFYAMNSSGSVDMVAITDYSFYSNQPYYMDAFAAGKIIVTKPSVDTVTGVEMISIASPIVFNGNKIGVVVISIALERFSTVKMERANYPSLRFAIAMDDGTIVYHSVDSNKIGENLSTTYQNPEDDQKAIQAIDNGQKLSLHCIDGNGVDSYKFLYPVKVLGSTWVIANSLDYYDMTAEVIKVFILLIVISVISLVVSIFSIIIILKRMLNPINKVVEAAKDISQGNLSIVIDVNSQDEIGILASTFGETANYLKGMIGEISGILNNMANNNFNVSIQSEYLGDFNQIKISLTDIITNLNTALSHINLAADQVAVGSDQVASGAQALSQGATQQASSVQQLAATINEISQQVKDNAKNANRASDMSNIVAQEIDQSNEKMNTMTTAMTEISQSSSEIEKIIKTIEDIAFQTNILALNAAVEAARAGEAGKGFAVVADEVRNLASKSAEASKDTAILIENSIKAVERGTQIANETAKTLIDAVESTKKATVTINKISQASEQQASAIEQITLGIEQISSVVQTNSATSEQSAAASQELSSQAQMMKNIIDGFQLKSDNQNSLPNYNFESATNHLNHTPEYLSLSDKYE